MGTTEEQDLAVLNRLEELGSDMTKPHKVDFFLYFKSEENARSAVREIEDDGFSVNLRRAEAAWWKRLLGKTVWSCRAMKSFVPAKEAILKASADFEEIAQRFDGEYDGWGAGLEK